MLDEDGLSVLGADHGACLISVLEVLALPSMSLLNIPWTIHCLGLHRHEGLESVTPVDVEYLGYRTQAMGSIDVSLMLFIKIKPPCKFADSFRFRLLNSCVLVLYSKQSLPLKKSSGH